MNSDILIFLGRFHPLIVHLPIGFLVLAVLFQVVEYIARQEFPILEHAIRYALLLGAITALLAVASGWVLAENSRYSSSTLDWHRWGGVAVMVMAFVAWILKTRLARMKSLYYKSSLTLLVLALMTTGHWGGSLTHGDDYLLEHAPTFIRHMLLPAPDTTNVQPLPDNPDSVQVYADLVHPILEAKCISCHNVHDKSGGLDMTSEEEFLNGGDEGEVLIRGNASKSGLFQRVTLPMDHSKFMPPQGDPFTYTEIRILEWWINQGGAFDATLSELDAPDDLLPLFLEEYGVDLRPRPFYETMKVEPASRKVLENLRESGFQVNELSESNHFLRLKAGPEVKPQDNFEGLIAARDHIVFMNLSGTQVTDKPIEIIGQLENLYHLDLSNTSVTDEGLAYLKSLDRLGVLNLYGTAISDQGLAKIKFLPALQKIYLWRTNVTEEFINQWKKEKPELEVVRGSF